MTDIGNIQQREIVDEMRESYLDYAMSVIVSRALPDVRDGLKPVHRRILYAMYEMGLGHAAKYRKCAAVVGEVLGKYHPHGDTAVYDSLARMAQDFSLRYPLIDGQGNFGCFTSDTKVHLVDGRDVSFLDLIAEVEQGKVHYTYTYNHQTAEVEIARVNTPRLTKKNAVLINVTLDNGSEIRCTPDHRFLLRNGVYREAKDLMSGDSLMPANIRISTKQDDPNVVGYEMVYQPEQRRWDYVHHLADAWNLASNVYRRADGKIRHHADFNKRNNNPENIVRLQWKAHWRAHYEFTSQRHKTDPEYRRKLAEGRAAYYASAKVKEKIGARMRAWNQRMWKRASYRNERVAAVKKLWNDPAYRAFMAGLSSTRLKKKWGEEAFRKSVGAKKSQEMKRRWHNAAYRGAQAERMRVISRELWQNPQHREHIARCMKDFWKVAERRAEMSKRSKSLWNDSDFRAKFSREHFTNAAKKLWEDPSSRAFHREKIKRQWEDPAFREKNRRTVSAASKARLARDPDMMHRMAAQSAAALRVKWQDAEYKKTVMRSKVLRFVSGLLATHAEVTPVLYERERKSNWVPRLDTGLQYFSSFPEIVEQAKHYNHKVLRVEPLDERGDVYDLTIDGTHNFALAAGIFVHNSIDGDYPAAMRYTESRMTRIAEELLRDIEKDTVDFRDNYDATRREPVVLPASVPNLLLNGTLGIAVGMATNIPPHNLKEIVDATAHLVGHPDASSDDLCEFVKGPDFPTGGIIYDEKEIRGAYTTGKGAVLNRGKADIEDGPRNSSQIVITAIPYQVNKAELIERMAGLVQEKTIEGVRDIRDESDREGLRIVVELKQDAHPQKVLNNFYKHTDLERTFHLNMLALSGGIQPMVMPLKDVLAEFIKHREEVVTRRTKFDLARTRERIHILEGLKIALDHIDQIIATIRTSADREEAHTNLVKKFRLSDVQASAILDMRLSSLAGLERQKVEDELKEKAALARTLEALLKDARKIKDVIKKELADIKDKYGDERKTAVVKTSPRALSEEDLIPDEEVVVVLTRGGYIKRVRPEAWRVQKRGGKGLIGMETKEEDTVERLLACSTHAALLFFTDTGKVYRVPAYEVPEGTRTAKGKTLFNVLSLSAQEHVTSVLAIPKKLKGKAGTLYVVMATKDGIMKKVEAASFENVRSSGLIALTLKSGDLLRWVKLTAGRDDIVLVTQKGQSIRFRESDVRPMGRTAAGVHAMRLRKGDEIVGMDVIVSDKAQGAGDKLLVVMEHGFGKQTPLAQYKRQRRGGSGIKTAKVTPKTGNVVSASLVGAAEEEMIAISRKGQVIRTALGAIPALSRATQGVRIMRLEEGDAIASVTTL